MVQIKAIMDSSSQQHYLYQVVAKKRSQQKNTPLFVSYLSVFTLGEKRFDRSFPPTSSLSTSKASRLFAIACPNQYSPIQFFCNIHLNNFQYSSSSQQMGGLFRIHGSDRFLGQPKRVVDLVTHRSPQQSRSVQKPIPCLRFGGAHSIFSSRNRSRYIFLLHRGRESFIF